MNPNFTKMRTFLFCVVLVLALSANAQKNSIKSAKLDMHHEVMDQPFTPDDPNSHPRSKAYTYKGVEFFTTQVNVDQNGLNIVGDAANEPSIGIDPKNPNRMVIGWRQFDNVNNSFRQAGYGYSTNGGNSWTFPGVIDPGIFRSDPVLDTDSSGTFYYNSLTKDEMDNYTCQVFRSYDGGATWDAGTFALGGDKQWMVIDKSGGMGDGHIYAFWTYYYSICNPKAFTRSIDKGSFYEDCYTLDGQPHWGTLAVGPEGELYTVGANDLSVITVTKSTTAMDPLYPVSWDFTSEVFLDGELSGWSDINPAGLTGQTNIAVDYSETGKGNVYVLASVDRLSNTDPADVMFSRSTDGGLSWSAPVRVNDDESTSNYQWFGTMSVAPNGRIDVVWLDTRANLFGFLSSALYYSYSLDQGMTWSANVALSEPFDSRIGWPQQNKMGDYYHMISSNEAAHLAWCGTFNGEQDVYYGRIAVETSGIANQGPNLSEVYAFPNPAKDQTTLKFNLSKSAELSILIQDVCGNTLSTKQHGKLAPGSHAIALQTEGLKPGVYFCTLVSAGQKHSLRLMVME